MSAFDFALGISWTEVANNGWEIVATCSHLYEHDKGVTC